jgi:hypothetical protein
MDDYSKQCYTQLRKDYEAGRITLETYNVALASIILYPNSGYVKV